MRHLSMRALLINPFLENILRN